MILHLRASRYLLVQLCEQPANAITSSEKLILGFALENYCFLTLMTNVTPYGVLTDRVVPFDSFSLSLAHLENYEGFGIFFSLGYSLFETIPQIALLARDRLREEECSQGKRTPESNLSYQAILECIENWSSTPPNTDMEMWQIAHDAAGELWRRALLIYLKTSMCGSLVSDITVRREIQSYVSSVLALYQLVQCSPYGTIMMWPMLMTGSCVTQREEQQFVSNAFRVEQSKMLHLSRAIELLEILWKDDDQRSYGPYGLFLMMAKHNLQLCIA